MFFYNNYGRCGGCGCGWNRCGGCGWGGCGCGWGGCGCGCGCGCYPFFGSFYGCGSILNTIALLYNARSISQLGCYLRRANCLNNQVLSPDALPQLLDMLNNTPNCNNNNKHCY